MYSVCYKHIAVCKTYFRPCLEMPKEAEETCKQWIPKIIFLLYGSCLDSVEGDSGS